MIYRKAIMLFKSDTTIVHVLITNYLKILPFIIYLFL